MSTGSELDAIEIEPAVMPMACHEVNLTIRQHIETQSELMVVDVEDQTLLRAAVTWKGGQRVAHAVPPD